MQKFLLWVVILGLAGGCQTDNASSLSPVEFTRHFTTFPSDLTGTNTTAGVKTRPVVPGMVLNVMVDEDRTLNKQYPVPPSGTLDFAGAGRLSVVGLTTDEIGKKNQTVLERDFFQKATVTVTIETPETVVPGATPGAGVVYVLGAVNRPGPLLLPPNEAFTLTKVIIASGNFTTFAKGTAVRVIRYDASGRKYQTTVNVAQIMRDGNFEDDIPVQSGDWIIVPEKVFSF
jgi:protein involved in polysaccharide export with SLBB domain